MLQENLWLSVEPQILVILRHQSEALQPKYLAGVLRGRQRFVYCVVLPRNSCRSDRMNGWTNDSPLNDE